MTVCAERRLQGFHITPQAIIVSRSHTPFRKRGKGSGNFFYSSLLCRSVQCGTNHSAVFYQMSTHVTTSWSKKVWNNIETTSSCFVKSLQEALALTQCEIPVQQVAAKKATRLVLLLENGVWPCETISQTAQIHSDKLNALTVYRSYWGKLDNKILMHA